MLNVKKLTQIGLYLLLVQSSFSAFADINTYFKQIKHDPNALYSFFKAMPKGGELHYHLTGSAYPEVMLNMAAASGDYCFDHNSWQIKKTSEKCLDVPAKQLMHDSALYERALRAWSLKDFDYYGSETAHDHFFATFYKFYALVVGHDPELLVDVMKRAANQHEQYLEVMMMPDPPDMHKLPNTIQPLTVHDFAQRRNELLANPSFQSAVNWVNEQGQRDLKIARELLNCGEHPERRACQLTVKFQFHALREQPLDKVFEQALLGFLVVQKSSDFVGVNLVQAEDGLISLRDYRKQMQIFKFLHQVYPDVAISLHAGELNPQAVMPKDTRFHIRDAIQIGHANRIGHGVDIAHENNPENIMRTMKQQDIAVEINLSSNAAILNIKGRQHPLNYYLAHHVPVVLSTDDEGILRTDLTSQYVEAVYHHGLDYPVIKQINRNALTYSFLPGKSLWVKPSSVVRVDDCADLNSERCVGFVKENEKARLQRQLELLLNQFESLLINYTKNG